MNNFEILVVVELTIITLINLVYGLDFVNGLVKEYNKKMCTKRINELLRKNLEDYGRQKKMRDEAAKVSDMYPPVVLTEGKVRSNQKNKPRRAAPTTPPKASR